MPQVLVVDDDPSVRDTVTTVLEVLGGWSVEICADGATAIARLGNDAQPSPDLIVLDVMMPRVGGYEVLRWIREHDVVYDLPVVMLTAKAAHVDEICGWDHGCDAYVTKPFEPTVLIETVEAALAADVDLRIARRQARLAELLTAR